MKKLFNLIVLTLAMNFLLVAGGVGWMVKSGRLDKAKALEVKKMLFEPTTQPVTVATAGPDNATVAAVDAYCGWMSCWPRRAGGRR